MAHCSLITQFLTSISVFAAESNGVAHSITITNPLPLPKKDHKKHSEKEREKDKTLHQSIETSSEKCSYKFSHSNGSLLHADIEIIERVG